MKKMTKKYTKISVPEMMAEDTDVSDIGYTARAVNDVVEKSFGFDISRDGDSENTSTAWSSEVKAHLDTSTLKSLFFSEDWVNISVDLLANKISSQIMQVMTTTVEDEQEVTDKTPDHPLNLLMENPNEWQDYHAFMYNCVVELFLMGNCILWFNKRGNNLIILPADQVTLNFNEDGSLKEYIMGAVSVDNQGLVTHSKEKSLTFPADEIMHIRRPNPSSMLWGLSPFIAGRKAILFNRYSTDYLNSFYVKQATPALAITIDRKVNEQVALRQLRAMEMAYTGRRNQRRTMVLPQGVEAKPLSHSIADQRLLDHVNSNRETILALLKIPKHEVGLQTAGSLGSEEYKIALRNFWESTLKPAMRQIEGGFNKFFKDELGPDSFFQFDLDDVEALQEDKERKADIAIKLLDAGWTINETRELFEKEPVELDSANTPKPLLDVVAASVELPTPQAEPEVEPEDEDEPEDKSLVVSNTADITKIFNKAGADLNIHTKALEDEVEKVSGKFLEMMLDRFVDMAESAIKVFKDEAVEEKKLTANSKMQTLVHKAAKVDKRHMRRKIREAFADLEEQYVEDGTEILESTVDFGYDSQLRFVLNEPGIDELEALKARGAKRRRLTLEARNLESFANIGITHTEKIMREIDKGVESSETVDQIARRISNTFKDPDAMLKHSKTIARTETLTAVSLGQWAAVQNAKDVIPNLTKIWITAGDERVRSSHTNNNGVRLPVNEKFSNDLRYPRDPSGDADETINCRCTMIMVPADEDPGSIPDDLN